VLDSWTEPLILLLIIANVVILTIQSTPNVYKHPRPAHAGYFHTWEDYALFVLFTLFSMESLARILVSGFILSPSMSVFAYVEQVWQGFKSNASHATSTTHKPVLFPYMASSTTGPKPSSTHDLPYGKALSVPETSRPANTLQRGNIDDPEAGFKPSKLKPVDSVSTSYPPPQSAPSTVKSFKSTTNLLPSKSASDIRRMINKSATFHEDVPFVRAVQNARNQRLTDQKAYLRHSWNRVDFLAILSFWVMFILAITGVEAQGSVYIFRALSVLRAARLLTVTAGTTVRV